MFAAFAVVLVGVVAAFVYRDRRRKRVLALAWPHTIGFQKMINLVDAYLKHQGWQIYTPIHNVHIKVITKGDDTIRLICQPSLVEYNGTKLKDLSQVALEPGRRPLVCITTAEVPHHLRALAAGGQVLLLHYKKLDIFAAPHTGLTDTLNAMCTALLENKQPTPEGTGSALFR